MIDEVMVLVETLVGDVMRIGRSASERPVTGAVDGCGGFRFPWPRGSGISGGIQSHRVKTFKFVTDPDVGDQTDN
ncbi:hypothetical protein [Mycobacterium leprae]|uniref:hypothetical protein n=1 Tax=Mycobacterium leprae TaxID=1769 RepID=UPI00059E79D8|nr:hypothetical protein [Mycobacterium leprae]OAR20509.1 hypothetical protein A8144_02530 [Mycobacterium leprae 3125609]